MAHDPDPQTCAFVATVNAALARDWREELPTFARESVVAVACDRAAPDAHDIPRDFVARAAGRLTEAAKGRHLAAAEPHRHDERVVLGAA
jgi:hypothetical protein